MKWIASASLALIVFASTSVRGNSGPTASDAQIHAGEKLFLRHCSECHGAGGQGTDRAPSISGFVRSTDPAVLHSFIRNGNLRRGMPSWSRLPDQRLKEIVVYLKSLDTPGE